MGASAQTRIPKFNLLLKSEFTNILKPHYDDAVNYCRALCSGSSKAEAEDVMQMALLKAYESIDSLNEVEKFRSWFFQIITRTFYNTVRRPFWKRFVSLRSEEGEVAFNIYEKDFFEDNQLLIGALAQISKKERAAFLLFEIGGFSISEITQIQQENSESTVKSRLSRTRTKLKEFMVRQEKAGIGNVSKSGFSTIRNSKDIYHETVRIIEEIKSIG